jgi:hypothetical protein
MNTSSSSKNPARYAIATASDGKRAQMPEKFAAKLDHKAINSTVMQARRGSALDRGTWAAMACAAVAE